MDCILIDLLVKFNITIVGAFESNRFGILAYFSMIN